MPFLLVSRGIITAVNKWIQDTHNGSATICEPFVIPIKTTRNLLHGRSREQHMKIREEHQILNDGRDVCSEKLHEINETLDPAIFIGSPF